MIQSVPTDAASSSSGEPIYTLEAVSDFFSETKLKIDKIENTDLISEIGVEVNDKLKENLEKIGSVIGTALKVALAAAVTDMPANRTVIDVAQYLAANKEWQPLPLNQGWVYKLALSPNVKPAGAILAKDFFNNMAGKTIGVLPVSACYDATLYLYKGADTGPKDPSQWDTVIPFQQKIADSQYVQTVALPSKGKIKMHSSCGVSVVNEGTGVNPIYGTLEAAIKQAEAIKKAIDDSKKNDDDWHEEFEE